MTPSRRQGLAALAVAGTELYFFARYAENGALFHFWLHLLLGGYVGLSLLALRRLARGTRSRVRAWHAGFFGHLYSALPDVLFLAVGLLHATWMDLFALHITAHFLWPNALVAGLVLWALAVLAFVAAVWGARRVAAGALAVSAVLLGAAFVLRAPLPSTLGELRAEAAAQQSFWQQLASSDWLCSVTEAARHGHVAGP
jgi:uncharacterized protein YqgC (DUF456 family)